MKTIAYHIDGMTCQGCVDTVTKLLSGIEGAKEVKVTLQPPLAEVTSEKDLSENVLNTALKGKYSLSSHEHQEEMETKGFIETYKPVLIIAGYIAGLALLRQYSLGNFNTFTFMNDFMAGFFLVFSFFKILDVKGFADSYAMYDIIAKHFKGYAYVYPFMELALGITYFTGFNPVITNTATAIIMGVSSIGVLQNAFSGRKIQCACLGTVFNLPVSTITIIEDLLMFTMSVYMLKLLIL